jgi:hypothetical protein
VTRLSTISPRALLALALLLFGGNANAGPSIWWSGQQDRHLVPAEPDFDLNSDFLIDFLFRNIEGTLYLAPLDGNAAVADDAWQPGHLNYRPVAEGTFIHETLDAPNVWDHGENYLVSYMMHEPSGEVIGSGPWHGVQNGLLGFSFDVAGETHYGWVRMSDVSQTAFILHDWAYETQPGLGINAGVVPEPGTMALFACGLGVLGWSRWRKKRCRTKP